MFNERIKYVRKIQIFLLENYKLMGKEELLLK